jgi:hypothetical protein
MTPRTHTTGINHLLSSVASKNAIKNNHIPPNPNQPAPGKHTVVTPWVSIHFRSPDPQGRENPSIDHDPRGSNRHRPEDARLDRRLWPFFFGEFPPSVALAGQKRAGTTGQQAAEAISTFEKDRSSLQEKQTRETFPFGTTPTNAYNRICR